METSEITAENDDSDLKPPEIISDELKENSKDSDSREVKQDAEDEDSCTVSKGSDEADKEVAAGEVNERKRFQEKKLDSEQPPKRSRLDEVIGKLGSVIGISPETVEQVDSDSESEESHHSESSGVKSEAEDVTSVSDDEDDKTSQATSQSSTKTIRLSSKVSSYILLRK